MNTTNDKSEIGASSEEVFRVGILTYLTQLNYGGVLQAFALQDVLQRLGAHVKVIDYWLVPNNALLRGLFAGPLVGALASWCAGVILACGRWMDTIRRVRTVRFIRGQLSLTDYHFVTWKEMEGKENRRAQFRTAICLIEGGKETLFEGIVKGEIIREKRGGSGFGYDPVFVPEGYTETFAEMGNEEKNKISHRARAVQQLCAYLL